MLPRPRVLVKGFLGLFINFSTDGHHPAQRPAPDIPPGVYRAAAATIRGGNGSENGSTSGSGTPRPAKSKTKSKAAATPAGRTPPIPVKIWAHGTTAGGRVLFQKAWNLKREKRKHAKMLFYQKTFKYTVDSNTHACYIKYTKHVGVFITLIQGGF